MPEQNDAPRPGFDLTALHRQLGLPEIHRQARGACSQRHRNCRPPPEQESAASLIANGRVWPERLQVYFDASQRLYWVPNSHDGWILVDKHDLRRMLVQQGVSAERPDDGSLSEFDRLVIRIQTERDVAYAGPLAGYDRGLHDIEGSRVLVTQSPRLIEPAQGEWPLLARMFDQQFNHGGVDQRPHLFGWLKMSAETLRAKRRRPGQVLVLAGKRDTGKSLFQNLFTCMFGGRVAKPFQFMTGGTGFNADLFGAEHLMIEDEAALPTLAARRSFGAFIKNFTVNEVHRCHAKFKTPVSLTPYWRVTISVNDEPENLMVLPPLDESLVDKIMLLLMNRPTLQPTQTQESREAFWRSLVSELPHFLYYLLEWEIPPELRSDRFGVTHFHHPHLVAAIDDLAPEERLMDIIDEVLFRDFEVMNPADFEGTAGELERRLYGSDAWEPEVRRLLTFPSACGVYLGRLANKNPERVTSRRMHGRRLWRIQPPSVEQSS
ncbi:MAG: hypothetical protein HZA90_14860 [Verrucomicrobia bacterium]|nr:hypothetical protein [Verrucomicrobiota bacterium]